MRTTLLSLSLALTLCATIIAQTTTRSHPPLRSVPPAPKRALVEKRAFFVDADKGSNDNDGSKTKPWRTIQHALDHLVAGDTLYLRGGTYYENVRVSLTGKKDAPIRIASYPGEQAIIDGSLREFFETPAKAWEPVDKGGSGEYRSTRRYPNIRNVVGSFGDSMIGLHSYYHAVDLRSDNEFVVPKKDKSDVEPIYCGPGLWYDRASGRIHTRLAQTHLPNVDNYRGEKDPRKLPLILTPFRSVPLHVDQARHVQFIDLIIRGGGYNTVLLDQASDIEFDNVTIWAGTFGLRITGTQRLRMYRCGVHGNAPPWATRFEAGFNTYPGRTQRDITRLHTHALLVAQANGEYDVYAYPFNDDWDISYCEFTDSGADGLYLGGVNVNFHHNLIDNMRDDGIYLSQMYPRHRYLRGGAKLQIHQNHFRRALTMLAFGGTEDTRDTIYFYRNIVDMRAPVLRGRPSEKGKSLAPYMGHFMGDHGSPPWPSMYSYHNTIVVGSPARQAHLTLPHGSTADRPRRVFNNILIHLSSLPNFALADLPHSHSDGNLYWYPGIDAKRAKGYFDKYRASAAFTNSKKVYASGYESSSQIADPMFMKVEADGKVVNDYRLQKASPAIDAGLAIPLDWPDPFRKQDKGKPDLGAITFGTNSISVGRSASRDK